MNSLYLFSLAFLGFFAWPSGIAQKYRDSDIMFLVSFLIGLIIYITIISFQENPFLTLLLLVFFLAFLSSLVVAACTSTAKRIQITEKKGAWMTGALLWSGFMLGRALAAFFL
ncbi:MAG: hypothetical protein N2050_01955 [Flavobacteriales bacterium]|nr:hypothetical protein [Flavobacteriales bacterium]